MLTRSLAALAALLMLSLAAGCSDDGNDDDAKADDPATSESAPDPAATETDDGPAGSCTYVADAAPAAKEATTPPAEPAVAGELDLVITTNRGRIPLTVDGAAAPCTVNSFVSLAGQGYFDDTNCHRLVPGFVLQCGDPSATGSGGPGYSFADELEGDETYLRGTLAMANAGPDTNGSQFFIVTQDAQLGPDYTVFGSVSDQGMEVVDAIEAGGNGPDGVAPKKPVTITSVK
jgi:peptidyl-prolyl cis-trans isomerase B (cyclophilin B)